MRVSVAAAAALFVSLTAVVLLGARASTDRTVALAPRSEASADTSTVARGIDPTVALAPQPMASKDADAN